MRTTRQISITVPNEMADRIRARVASGRYASESEVIRDGLRALEEQEAAVERWLQTEVVAALAEYEANPVGVMTVEDVIAALEVNRIKRRKAA